MADAAQPPEHTLRAYLFLSTAALCWGGNTIFGRLAVGEVSPMAMVTLRWLFVVVLLMAFANATVRRDWPLLKPHLKYVAAMGACGFAAFNGLFYIAAHSTTALNMGIIQGAIPMFVLIGAFLVFRTPVTPMQMVGVGVTMAGVVTVASGGAWERLAALAVNFGDGLMVAACALYAGYTVALRKKPQASALGLFTVMAGAAFVVSLPMAATEMALGQFQWPTAKGWWVVGLVTLGPSFLAQITFIKGVEIIGPGRAGLFVNLVPVFSAGLAVAVLSEPFRAFHAAALALVLTGIWFSERGKA